MNTLRRRTLLSSDIITNDNSFDHSNYMTIEALEDLTVVSPRAVSYNIDGNGWNDNETTFNLKQGEFLSLKYNKTTGYTSFGTFQIDGACNLRGNCMSLVYGDNANENNSLQGYSYAFKDLFKNCDGIQHIDNLFLQATTLSDYCYYYMFDGCTSLTTAPELPATTLADYCYGRMFNGCTSLTSAPQLPATTLASYCYYSMFYGCESLKTTPQLPATTLADDCYYYMFKGCESLKTAPQLPATTLAGHCYSSMFYGCTSLTTAPELPATTLADTCYSDMFYGCTSLTTAPELPATTLAGHCYSSMFYGCTSLTTAPELLATTLAINCYESMFYGCRSLTTAPELPATTLARSCYESMFYGCRSLTTAPELPATTLADYCYNYMFQSCTSLVTALELPATTLADGCYAHMFQGCTSLTSAPKLPATTLADTCYSSMFYGCKSLLTAPELPATTLADGCYSYMFRNCSKLNYIKMLATDISASSCLYDWVYEVASSGTFVKHKDMTTLPNGISGIPYGWTVEDYSNEIDYYKEYFTIEALEDDLVVSLTQNTLQYRIDNGTWTSLSAETATPSINSGQKIQFKMNNPIITNSYGIGKFNITKECNVYGNIMSLLYGDEFKGQTNLSGKNYAFLHLFENCTTFQSIENLILPATTLASSCYGNMFYGCTSLTEAPKLPATTLASSCYDNMFYGCTSLTEAPKLPATTLANFCYSKMFYGCKNLVTAPELPATTLADDCYRNMFYDCTSLVNAPELPATTLADDCYNSMFEGCKNLVTAPELPATTLADFCYYDMFLSCSKLNYIKMLATDISATYCLSNWVNGVSSSGTFVKASGVDIPSGINGIPNGWTVEEYVQDTSDLITFTIGGTEYQAEEGMTWEEWVNSEYNNDIFFIYNNYINFIKIIGVTVSYVNNNDCLKTDTIIPNYAYIFNSNGSGSGGSD